MTALCCQRHNDSVSGSDTEWPSAKLNSLRLGKRLVAEVPASSIGRRAFVDILPERTPEDAAADHEGWVRPDAARSFVVRHWEYAEEYLHGFDYDIGAEQLASVRATGEAELRAVINSFGLTPSSFQYPWDTGDPR